METMIQNIFHAGFRYPIAIVGAGQEPVFLSRKQVQLDSIIYFIALKPKRFFQEAVAVIDKDAYIPD
jgi:hypothetical protein